MLRTLILCITALLASSSVLLAQTEESRLEELEEETARLKATLAEQGRRITELENTIKALQAILIPLPKPIPAPTPPWYEPSKWTLLRPGMSEAHVVEILGPPTDVDVKIDIRTLLYETGSSETRTLKGSVTLIDDRLSAAQPPNF